MVKRWFGAILAAILGLGLGMGLLEYVEWRAWSKVRAVSGEQIRQISSAILQYEKANNDRPKRLEDLVNTGLLERSVLYDRRRSKLEANPDVVYFPALRKGDPGGLVLLCTLLLKDKHDTFRVIYNDGRYAELTERELVKALNGTYKYIREAVDRR